MERLLQMSRCFDHPAEKLSMPRPYKPHIPQTTGELWDLIGSMTLGAPTFKDKTGYFPETSIDTEFVVLNGGIDAVRKKAGEERYAALMALSQRMPTVRDGSGGRNG